MKRFLLPILAVLTIAFCSAVSTHHHPSHPDDLHATTSTIARPSSTSTATQFFAWPARAISREGDEDRDSAFPLSTTWLWGYDRTYAVFSFTLSGSALSRHQQRQASRRLKADDTHSDAEGADAHDTHSDAHEMVVHVTYEDICEC